ncbi:MAG TPA: hypothetical protein VFW24_01545 [Acidimicrobiales bacterium]|nr:hypothetical protein [Acidimicrobiales bacterium]
MERLSSSSGAPGVTAPTAGGNGGGADWTVQVADRIDGVVLAVRDRSVVPLTLVARALVYGFIVLVAAVALAVVGAVAAVRALNVALPDWESEAVLGGFFALSGLFLLSRARRSARGAR